MGVVSLASMSLRVSISFGIKFLIFASASFSMKERLASISLSNKERILSNMGKFGSFEFRVGCCGFLGWTSSFCLKLQLGPFLHIPIFQK